MNIAQIISFRAQTGAEATALIGDHLTLSHGELDSAVGRAATTLSKQGVALGDVVGISLRTSPLQMLVILALARIGAISVHIHPAYPQAAKQAILRRFGVVAVVVEAGRTSVQWCSPIPADASWLEPGSTGAGGFAAGGDRPWRISLSSGTTGVQKGVLCTHARSMAYLNAHAGVVPNVEGRGRFLCHRGMDAQLALYPCLLHLIRGATVVIPANAGFGGIIEAIDRHQVTELIMSPAFLRDLLRELPACTNRFPSLEYLLVGGSPMPPEVMEDAVARLTPNLYFAYGASEVGRLAMADPCTLRRAPQSVGAVVGWARAEVVDEADRAMPPDTAGILRFRSELFAREYYRNLEASARCFRDGWFYPGDTGWLGADGLLVIGSRVDDTINLDGLKVEPSEVEQALMRHPAVEDAAAFGATFDTHRTGLFAAVKARAAVEERVLLKHCAGLLGRAQVPVRIFFVDRLPRSEAGKLLRGELSRRVVRGKRSLPT